MKDEERIELSIVMPVYNEFESVDGVIDSIRESGTRSSYEIVAVDDASTDGSSDILSRRADAGDIRLIRHQENQGYGAALKTGIREARSGTVMIIDGDGSYPASHFDEFISYGSEYDMVVGARGSGVMEEPLLRTWVKSFILRLLRFLGDMQVPDLNSGLRLMKRDQVMRYFHLLPDGISFTSTITLVLLSEGARVKYVPIDYFARAGSSKVRPFRDTLGMLTLILRTFLYFNPLKVFLPLSLVLLVVALLVGFGSIAAGKFMDVTTVVFLLSAVQVFVLGLLADLIAKRRS
ncbi:MAG: glycosyltransferase family 2 protein [bacterium]